MTDTVLFDLQLELYWTASSPDVWAPASRVVCHLAAVGPQAPSILTYSKLHALVVQCLTMAPWRWMVGVVHSAYVLATPGGACYHVLAGPTILQQRSSPRCV